MDAGEGLSERVPFRGLKSPRFPLSDFKNLGLNQLLLLDSRLRCRARDQGLM